MLIINKNIIKRLFKLRIKGLIININKYGYQTKAVNTEIDKLIINLQPSSHIVNVDNQH